MNTQITSPHWNNLLASTLGIVAVGFVWAYLVGWKLPWVSNDRAAFYTVAALGFGMCLIGMGKLVTGLGWTHPLTIAGTVLGVLILFIVVAVIAGWRIPPLTSDRAALITVAILGLVKWGLALFSQVVLKV